MFTSPAIVASTAVTLPAFDFGLKSPCDELHASQPQGGVNGAAK